MEAPMKTFIYDSNDTCLGEIADVYNLIRVGDTILFESYVVAHSFCNDPVHIQGKVEGRKIDFVRGVIRVWLEENKDEA